MKLRNRPVPGLDVRDKSEITIEAPPESRVPIGSQLDRAELQRNGGVIRSLSGADQGGTVRVLQYSHIIGKTKEVLQ